MSIHISINKLILQTRQAIKTVLKTQHTAYSSFVLMCISSSRELCRANVIFWGVSWFLYLYWPRHYNKDVQINHTITGCSLFLINPPLVFLWTFFTAFCPLSNLTIGAFISKKPNCEQNIPKALVEELYSRIQPNLKTHALRKGHQWFSDGEKRAEMTFRNPNALSPRMPTSFFTEKSRIRYAI